MMQLLYAYLSKRLVNDTRVLKMIVGEKIELIEEVSYVDTAQWVHLREG